MSKQWHILIVLDERYLNRNIVQSLQIDGYVVKGVSSATEAVHSLWAEEYDIVISDQKMPDSDGFELLQWMRTYRPKSRMIMIGMPGSSVIRNQALENGVVSYLEKPLDLHTLKEELRRLLQHTGFSASLDSFDLLDVVQMVNMSHKTIAMVVNTGLEEQGLLGFQAGELVWAEYGILGGEEAFFALAAHKNGTITHQPWVAQIIPNVTEPLSRLIFQALQYRSKYAEFQQLTGEHAVPSRDAAPQARQLLEDEDTPFLFVEPVLSDGFEQKSLNGSQETPVPVPVVSNEEIEWWQEGALQEPSQKIRIIGPEADNLTFSAPLPAREVEPATSDPQSVEPRIIPAKAHKTPAVQRTDLPSWLIDQPTEFEMPALKPSSLVGSNKVPAAPDGKAKPMEKQAQKTTFKSARREQMNKNAHSSPYWQSSPEWQVVEKPDVQQLQSLTTTRKTDDFSAPVSRQVGEAVKLQIANPAITTDDLEGEKAAVHSDVPSAFSRDATSAGQTYIPGNQNRNYSSLVTALQTLRHSISGFIATAIVNIDGYPIAQVAVDDQDISQICGGLGKSMQGVLQALEAGAFGHYEDTIITSLTHFILYRLIGSGRGVFQVLIVTRDADPVECLEIMTNIEPVLEAAL
ncbi:MAG TPA: response regulator [Ktedonobacteraceae bacterium]|nr:response regulator [Ktedonobacteraceae bacterium]